MKQTKDMRISCPHCGVKTWMKDRAAFMRDHDRIDGRKCQKAAKEAKAQESNEYMLIVGNIGTVYTGHNGFEANTLFQSYVSASHAKHGRASGEDVTLFKNGEPHREYIGRYSREEEAREELERGLIESAAWHDTSAELA